LQRPLMRTSESKGDQQLYDSSAPFEPEVGNRLCSTMCANFGFGALGADISSLSRMPLIRIF
jgi:hypothetical protein